MTNASDFDAAVGKAAALPLSEPQTAVLRHLSRLDTHRQDNSPELALIYRGALEAIHSRNSDRFALASHNLRELIRLMPHALLDEVKSLDERMGDKVHALASEWTRATTSLCHDGNGEWKGEIDGRLRRFLGRASMFFGWVVSNRQGRRQEIADALHRLDASGRRLPPPLAKINADYWQEMADYFVGVCHHSKATTEDEFLMYLDALETFLVQRIQPMTFERTRELQDLIEGRAQNA